MVMESRGQVLARKTEAFQNIITMGHYISAFFE
jgi:hypothetical protein